MAPNPRTRLATVVAKGDRRKSLELLAIRLAERVDSPLTENVAPVAAQLRATLADIDEIAAPEASRTDELAEQRRRRREEAAVQPRTARGKQRGG